MQFFVDERWAFELESKKHGKRKERQRHLRTPEGAGARGAIHLLGGSRSVPSAKPGPQRRQVMMIMIVMMMVVIIITIYDRDGSDGDADGDEDVVVKVSVRGLYR